MSFLNSFFSFLFLIPLLLSSIPYLIDKKEADKNWAYINLGSTFMVSLIFSAMALADSLYSKWCVQLFSGSSSALYWGGAMDDLSSHYLLVCLWQNFFCKLLVVRDKSVEFAAQGRLFFYLDLFLVAAFISICATHFFPLMLGWELLSVVSYLLLSFSYESSSSNQAAFTAFLYDKMGSVFLLLGGGILIFSLGDKNFTDPQWLSWSRHMIGIFFFVGIYSRLLQLGVNTWILHTQEISSISLSVVVNFLFGLPAFALLGKLHLVEGGMLKSVALCIGLATFVFASAVALIEPLLKKVISYLSIAHWGMALSLSSMGMYKISFKYLLAVSMVQFVFFAIEQILSARNKDSVRLEKGLFLGRGSWLILGLIILWAVAHTLLVSFLGMEVIPRCPINLWLILLGGIILSITIWRPVFSIYCFFIPEKKEEPMTSLIEEWVFLCISAVIIIVSVIFFGRLIGGRFLESTSIVWLTLVSCIGSGVAVWAVLFFAFKGGWKMRGRTSELIYQVFLKRAYLEIFYDKSLVTTFKWVSGSLSQKVDSFLIEEQAFEGSVSGLSKVHRFICWIQNQTFSLYLFFFLLACLGLLSFLCVKIV